MKQRLLELFDRIESAPFSLGLFTLTFLALITVRIGIEQGIERYETTSLRFLFLEFSHTLLFFLFAFLAFLPIARFAGATSWIRAANLLLAGFLVIWTPPIIDRLIFGSYEYWRFYELDGILGLAERYITFFGSTPDVGITYGVRVEVALMTLGLGLYAWLRKKSLKKALTVALFAYTAFFILGTFPSSVAIPVVGIEKGLFAVTELDVTGMMLAPDTIFSRSTGDSRSTLNFKMSLIYALLIIIAIGTLLYRANRKVFLALLRNARIPQAIWHGGLLFVGGALAILFTEARLNFGFFEILAVLVLVAAVESAWLASVAANDLVDQKIDALTNPSRPLPAGDISERLYATIGSLFFFASLLLAAIVSSKLALLLIGYQALATLYSMTPLRLKRVPLLATLFSALAGMLILFVGYFAISPSESIEPVPLSLLGFLLVAYTVTLPLKDFKDIAGDRKDGVYTIPVLLGAERARLVIGSALFLVYAVSPIILRETSLIVPAIFSGSLAFFSIIRAERSKRSRITFRSLAGWNILFITLYGFLAAFLLFA